MIKFLKLSRSFDILLTQYELGGFVIDSVFVREMSK